MKRCSFALPGVALLLVPLPALADVVWPALYLETRLFTWWAISLGLFIEFFFIRWLFTLSVQKAALATVAANAVSTLLGAVLVPVSGLVWEIFPGLVVYKVFNVGTFNPATWAATFILACLVTTGNEALVYKYGFKFLVRRREFFWLLVANALSVLVAFVSVFIVPVRM